jgi:hypothetical protein
MSTELDNARRTIDKAEDALQSCERYFARQAEMNAQAHMSERVMHPPIHAAISSVLHGIAIFRESYPKEL